MIGQMLAILWTTSFALMPEGLAAGSTSPASSYDCSEPGAFLVWLCSYIQGINQAPIRKTKGATQARMYFPRLGGWTPGL